MENINTLKSENETLREEYILLKKQFKKVCRERDTFKQYVPQELLPLVPPNTPEFKTL